MIQIWQYGVGEVECNSLHRELYHSMSSAAGRVRLCTLRFAMNVTVYIQLYHSMSSAAGFAMNVTVYIELYHSMSSAAGCVWLCTLRFAMNATRGQI